MHKKLAAVATLSSILSACASMTQHAMGDILKSWQGAPVANVISAWGKPTQKFPGTETTLYQWTDSQHQGLLSFHTDRNTEAPPSTLLGGTCTRQLIVNNASGIVGSGRYQGNNCCVAAAAGYCKSLKRPS